MAVTWYGDRHHWCDFFMTLALLLGTKLQFEGFRLFDLNPSRVGGAVGQVGYQ
jgi:hypothetical protein